MRSQKRTLLPMLHLLMLITLGQTSPKLDPTRKSYSTPDRGTKTEQQTLPSQEIRKPLSDRQHRELQQLLPVHSR